MVIYSKSVTDSTTDIPHDWKMANVSTLFKKVAKMILEIIDLRVCLTVHGCTIRDAIMEHLEKFTLIFSSQHSFMKKDLA